MEIALLGLVILIAVAAFGGARRSRRAPQSEVPKTEPDAIAQQFRNVYALVIPERQETIIRYYMDERGCSTREAAMLAAIADNEKDRIRW